MMGEYEEEEQQITHLDVNQMDLLPPRPAPKPELASRKCWHPVVLDTNPPPIIEETTGDEVVSCIMIGVVTCFLLPLL
jgi:hypothetical protein